jgi:hypothetical protein
MADHSQMKLGRKAIKTDTRTLAFGDYLTPALPPPPAAADWTKGITSWGMMLNDTLGDCTIAGCGHAVQVWTANTSGIVTLPDPTIESYYEQWDGYVPGNPNTDNGGVELVEIQQSIALFAGVYIGLSLPLTAQTQAVWDVVKGGGAKAKPGSWGGHCVYVPKYDANGFTCITWGQPKTMTLAFWKKYCDEAHTLFGQDWLTAKGAPSGFDQAQLQTDLADIK